MKPRPERASATLRLAQATPERTPDQQVRHLRHHKGLASKAAQILRLAYRYRMFCNAGSPCRRHCTGSARRRIPPPTAPVRVRDCSPSLARTRPWSTESSAGSAQSPLRGHTWDSRHWSRTTRGAQPPARPLRATPSTRPQPPARTDPRSHSAAFPPREHSTTPQRPPSGRNFAPHRHSAALPSSTLSNPSAAGGARHPA